MDESTQRALEAIDEAVEWARQLPTGPVPLSAEYLAAIEKVEQLPQNQPGADKTWMERARQEFIDHFRRARRR